MIMSGQVDEGLECVAAVRQRYDGERRNPWNEFECGSNYARSMASYALLNAFSGFEFDLTHGRVGFNPIRLEDGHFRCFWSLAPGWGEVVVTSDSVELRVLYGELPLTTLRLPFLAGSTVRNVSVEGAGVAFAQQGGDVALERPATIYAGQVLVVAR